MTQLADRAPSFAPPTDFGRQMQIATPDTSLVAALREHAARAAAREAWNTHLIWGLVGFGGGLAVIVPLVVWLASGRPDNKRPAVTPATASVSGSLARPSLVSVPVLVPPAPPKVEVAPLPSGPVAIPARQPPAPPAPDPLAEARAKIRAGDLLGARQLLRNAALADSGEAHFVLAETFDPNVLAALGVEAHLAEAETAKRHYQLARDRGIAIAAKRLEALE